MKNAYRKFNLQVYADHGHLFTIYPINIVTNIIQMHYACSNGKVLIVQMLVGLDINNHLGVNFTQMLYSQMLYSQISWCVLVQLGHVTMMRMTCVYIGTQSKWPPDWSVSFASLFSQIFLEFYHKYAQLLLEYAKSMSNRGFYIHYSRWQGITVSINLEFNPWVVGSQQWRISFDRV